MNATRLTCLAVLSFSLVGCGILKKKQPEPAASVATPSTALTPPPPVAPTADPAPVVAAPAALDEAAVPAPQDFEDEAFEKVTTANFKAELARLTKEITTPAAK
ncbi:MAG: hypothetical protein K0R38_2830 [Polyangiaceae bacterium]|jgi:hypothetical protein|nr:hypothetical protein [Polyangiaceae bacterium]